MTVSPNETGREAVRSRGTGLAARGDSALAVAAALLVLLALVIAARGLIRHNNWYLASDQFAFLTFAADLRRGAVFHDDAVFEEISPERSPRKRYDALSQTYFWRGGELYSRYPPGFPALLALAGAIGGEAGEHALNPILYLGILSLVAFATWMLVAPRDGPLGNAAAAMTAWLVLLLETGVHLWGITVVRDLPAHMLALLAILAATAARPVLAGLALGAACVIRVDAVLYGIAFLVIARVRRATLREGLVATAAFLVGVAPLLLYNLATEGAPFSFTEGGEFRELWSRAVPSGAVTAQVFAAPSGGGFRWSHLRETLPANALHLLRAFGWLAPFGLAGIVWALRERPLLAAALLPYPAAAVVFYSFWVHPDFRYLAGASLCLIPIAAVGIAVAYRRFAAGDRIARILGLALGATAIAALFLADVRWRPGAAAISIYAGAAIIALLPRREWLRRAAPLVGALALALPATWRAARSEAASGPFQRAEVTAARAAIASLIPPGSLVMTSHGLGRIAENLRVYTDVEAFYPGEMALLDRPVDVAAVVFAGTGRRVFYLLPTGERETEARVRGVGTLRPIAQRSGRGLLEWFIDPRRARRGATLYELDVTEEMRNRLRLFLRLGEPARRDGGAPPSETPTDRR
jgi:hypothetical protein